MQLKAMQVKAMQLKLGDHIDTYCRLTAQVRTVQYAAAIDQWTK